MKYSKSPQLLPIQQPCEYYSLEDSHARQLLTKAQAELEKLARVDALTSLYNRRVFDEIYEKEFSLAKRSKSNLSLLIIDVDYFKKFNDRYGHQKRDKCLQAISSCMQKHAQRMTDTCTRYGGEKFAIIMSDTDTKNAAIIAERIRSAIGELAIPYEESSCSNTVTVSMGDVHPCRWHGYFSCSTI